MVKILGKNNINSTSALKRLCALRHCRTSGALYIYFLYKTRRLRLHRCHWLYNADYYFLTYPKTEIPSKIHFLMIRRNFELRWYKSMRQWERKRENDIGHAGEFERLSNSKPENCFAIHRQNITYGLCDFWLPTKLISSRLIVYHTLNISNNKLKTLCETYFGILILSLRTCVTSM